MMYLLCLCVFVFYLCVYVNVLCVRHATLEESTLVMNGDSKGRANGAVSYYVPAEGRVGEVNYLVHVLDGMDEVALESTGLAQWESVHGWSDAGVVKAASLVHIPRLVYWDAAGDVQYDDNHFSVFSQYLTKTGSERLLLRGAGSYGGDRSAW